MTIERIGRSRTAARAGALAYAQRAEPPAPAEPVASATVLGIPEAEFTPRVREAIMRLMGEVESLRQDLRHTRLRLEDVERTADQDHLLPVLNRRAFVRELTRHIAFSARYATPASLVYFDLDGFKLVNDTCGHAGGDAVLAHFAQTLIGHVRESDVVGRLGGDEFGVILAHADQEQAHKKAALLMETLTTGPPTWDGRTLPVSFSYGAFELKAGESAEAAMACADEAMYRQKRGAR
jgi:diguanylate cyclase (GGDEF)-like protein